MSCIAVYAFLCKIRERQSKGGMTGQENEHKQMGQIECAGTINFILETY
jgi:hypothetical protein